MPRIEYHGFYNLFVSNVNSKLCFVYSDIDECAEGGSAVCQYGQCHNTEGSYRCTCTAPGFEVSPDGSKCVGKFTLHDHNVDGKASMYSLGMFQVGFFISKSETALK